MVTRQHLFGDTMAFFGKVALMTAGTRIVSKSFAHLFEYLLIIFFPSKFCSASIEFGIGELGLSCRSAFVEFAGINVKAYTLYDREFGLGLFVPLTQGSI